MATPLQSPATLDACGRWPAAVSTVERALAIPKGRFAVGPAFVLAATLDAMTGRPDDGEVEVPPRQTRYGIAGSGTSSRGSPQRLDLEQPRVQVVPTRENAAHHSVRTILRVLTLRRHR